MTIQQLRYFFVTAESGSINKAAEKLFISQPSLSGALRDLEEEVGTNLLTRTPRGISLTTDGTEFLGYVGQVLEQVGLLEQRWMNKKPSKKLCSISTQHYAFAVNAFVNLVKKTAGEEYDYTLRETKTHEIVEDVAELRSDVGILYLNNYNRQVIQKLLKEKNLVFHPLFTAKPHVFISRGNPLAKKKRITLEELREYPRLSFDQGEKNAFYFSEEILSTEYAKKDIRVGDRATIFNLMIGLNGYTISTGILTSDLNGEEIVAIPLDVEDAIEVGWICHKHIQMSIAAKEYIEELQKVVSGYRSVE